MLAVSFTAALAVLCSACSDGKSYELDGGTSDAAIVESNTLEIVGEATLSLASTEEATLTVQLRDAAGLPVAGSEVRFALDGRAHDSTLLEVSALTDGAGRAETILRAGTVFSAFRVRVSAADAAAVSFDVAVGDSGFGALEVTPLYEGERELPRVVVGVFTDATCEDDFVRRDAGDRTQLQSADDQLVRFVGLPVGPTYAVAVRGEGEGGAVLAWGCADGFGISETETTSVEVAYEDLPLMVDGSYDATVAFDMLSTPDAMADVLVASEPALLGASGAELILDAAAAALLDAGDTAGATALADARAAGFDATLQASLDDLAIGPDQAHDALVARVREGLSTLSITGRLRLNGGTISFAVQKVGVGSGELEVARTELEVPATIDATESGEQLQVESLTIELPTSAVLRALATREAFDRVLADGAAWLAFEAGCGELPAPTDAIGCDLACLQAACRAVVADYYAAALTSVEPLDAERSTFELSGNADLEDLRHDLQADSLSGSLGGTWTGPAATEPEAVEGELTGERFAPPT